MAAADSISSITRRNLIFISGKGGVGKTVVSQSLALALSKRGKRTLWATFEDPFRPPHELKQINPKLWHLNCDASEAFKEYAALKLGGSKLTQLFLQNKLISYLSKAAPGIHELVLLGKVWHERNHYDQVVVDMPSTGYGLAMFQSASNFSKLFHGGPINVDTEEMLKTFRDPKITGQLIVALPEEMPLRESLELDEFLIKLFPDNRPSFIVNRLFPKVPFTEKDETDSESVSWETPLASSAEDYARKRSVLETHNLRILRDAKVAYGELPFVPPAASNPAPAAVEVLSQVWAERGYLP